MIKKIGSLARLITPRRCLYHDIAITPPFVTSNFAFDIEYRNFDSIQISGNGPKCWMHKSVGTFGESKAF